MISIINTNDTFHILELRRNLVGSMKEKLSGTGSNLSPLEMKILIVWSWTLTGDAEALVGPNTTRDQEKINDNTQKLAIDTFI